MMIIAEDTTSYLSTSCNKFHVTINDLGIKNHSEPFHLTLMKFNLSKKEIEDAIQVLQKSLEIYKQKKSSS